MTVSPLDDTPMHTVRERAGALTALWQIRTAWRICSVNGWWSVFGKPKAYAKARKGPAGAR